MKAPSKNRLLTNRAPAYGLRGACSRFRIPHVSLPAQQAFTLIELILVMTVLTIAVSLTAPRLAQFFRGRSLESEARRVLALTRAGQSRAASEGVPVDLWFDADHGSYGLEADASYETKDPKAMNFTLDSEMRIELTGAAGIPSSPVLDFSAAVNTTSGSPVPSGHPNLPRIRFLPDGSISEGSPEMLRLIGRDEMTVLLKLSRSRLHYEILSK